MVSIDNLISLTDIHKSKFDVHKHKKLIFHTEKKNIGLMLDTQRVIQVRTGHKIRVGHLLG